MQMNVLGKIIGAITGFMLQGIPGAVVGAVLGHFVDIYTTWAAIQATNSRKTREARAHAEDRRNPGARYNFTLCVVSLGAKLAKIDGPVSKAEIAAFKEIFRVPPEELHNVGMMFDRARSTSRGYESFAEQLAHMFGSDRNTLDEVITGLFHVGLADGNLRPQETEFIHTVSRIFGFSESYFQRRMEEQVGVHAGSAYQGGYDAGSSNRSQGQGQRQQAPRPPTPVRDPYAVLGVTSSTSDAEIKLQYRKLVRKHHPDSMVASGQSKDKVAQATEKLALINAAYDEILKERQL